jgi:penicillin-binding protein 2
VNQAEKQAMEDWDDADQANYRGTEYIGKLGIEQAYEKQLHGITGVEQVETTASGRAVRLMASNPSTPGDTVKLSIDIKLQKMVEDLYGDRRGALVALNPKTGEVLAFVSKPTFDPNLFVDGIDPENWQALNESIDKPLLNRALRGTYPPGSTFKPYMALAALQTGKRTPQQTIFDPGYFWFGGHKFRDDKEGGHGTVDMYKSIVESCDTYYYMLANDLGVDTIHDQLQPFGFGELTGIDIAGESHGLLPSTHWKRAAYHRPEQQKWYAGETISLGIGQGYNNYTILQLADAVAALANDGVRMKPHLVSEVDDVAHEKATKVQPQEISRFPVKPEYIAFVRKAMQGVNVEGTSAAAFRGAPYTSGGKTGTAQVFTVKQGEKYRASQVDERHRDHALFIAFAPADDPKIALAMVVENGGFGASAAAPIARRVFDYWLMGLYPSEEDIAAVREAKAMTPIGKQRPVADVPWPPGGSGPGAPGAAASAPQAAASGAAFVDVSASAPGRAPAAPRGPAPLPAAPAPSVPAAGVVRTSAPAR